MNRRAVLASIGALGISGLAGCNTDTGQPASSNTPETANPSGTRTPTERPEDQTDSRLTVPGGSESGRWRDVDYGGDHSPPAPPSTLSADVVRDVAAEAEEAHIYDRLETADGLESFGVAGYTVSPGAYVADRNSDAVLVRVRLGYSYTCENSVVDSVSTATYRITTDEVERGDGTTIVAGC